MSDEYYNVPVEGEPSGPVEVPVTFNDDVEVRKVPVAPDPLAGLPLSVKEEALRAKIAALDAGKGMDAAAKAERKVVAAWRWSYRIEGAKLFLRWSALAAALCGTYWLAAHDWLATKYRPARDARDRAVKVAEAQYRVDVATVDLQEAKK